MKAKTEQELKAQLEKIAVDLDHCYVQQSRKPRRKGGNK